MRISCPYCKATGSIRDALVPDGGRAVVCPRCRAKFNIDKGATYPSPKDTPHPLPSPPAADKIPVACPTCGSSGTMAARLVPAGGTTVTCPKCRARFPVKRESPAPSDSVGGEVPFTCPKCNREGTIAASLVPEGGTGMNCPGCNARFYLRRPDDAKAEAPAPAPPATGPAGIVSTPDFSKKTEIAPPSIGDRGALSPSGPPHRARPASSSRIPASPSPGAALALDDIWSTPSVGRAVAGGAAAALVGALIWAFITVMTSYQIGWMAVGVGALVGFAVKFCGRGQDMVFGMVGAGFAMFGCMIGNLMASCAFISADPRNAGIGFISILFDAAFSPTTAFRIMAGTFNPIDVLFYVLAVSTGYKVSTTSE